jgi:hypothetical protein
MFQFAAELGMNCPNKSIIKEEPKMPEEYAELMRLLRMCYNVDIQWNKKENNYSLDVHDAGHDINPIVITDESLIGAIEKAVKVQVILRS